MAGWFSRLFRRQQPDVVHIVDPHPPVTTTADVSTRPAQAKAQVHATGGALREDEHEFLLRFLQPADVRAISEFSKEDQLFLGGIRNLWHSRKLDLPVLPQSALRLRELLRAGDVAISRFVQLVEQDSALAIKVLKAANSAAFGGAAPVQSTQDAIVRIGLQRLEALLLMSQMRAKVLRAGALQRKAELLVELGTPLAQVTTAHARHLGTDANVAFTRATLLHVEHLVILGAVAEVSQLHKQTLVPSLDAVHQAFLTFGPDIRDAVARAWQLEELLLGYDPGEFADEFAGLRDAVMARWLGQPLPPVAGVDPSLADTLLEPIPTRVHQAASTAA